MNKQLLFFGLIGIMLQGAFFEIEDPKEMNRANVISVNQITTQSQKKPQINVSLFQEIPEKSHFIKNKIIVTCSEGYNSMYPTFSCNQTLYYRNLTENEELEPYNVYVFEMDHQEKGHINVIHRLIKRINNTHYLFLGDNNKRFDPAIKKEAIKWQIIAKNKEHQR